MNRKRTIEIEEEELESLKSLVKSLSFYLAGLAPRLECELKFTNDIRHMIDQGLDIVERHLKRP